MVSIDKERSTGPVVDDNNGDKDGDKDDRSSSTVCNPGQRRCWAKPPKDVAGSFHVSKIEVSEVSVSTCKLSSAGKG
jgi:hypothetical protein